VKTFLSLRVCIFCGCGNLLVIVKVCYVGRGTLFVLVDRHAETLAMTVMKRLG